MKTSASDGDVNTKMLELFEISMMVNDSVDSAILSFISSMLILSIFSVLGAEINRVLSLIL